MAVALLVMVVGVGVASLSSWYGAERFPAAARKVEAMLRLARAEAAARGRRVRLEFRADPAGEGEPRPLFVWEPQPLTEPGQYVPFTAAAWTANLPADILRITRCERRGDSALRTLTYNEQADPMSPSGWPLQGITFQPDGGCDSAILELVSVDDSDGRTAVILLDATTGDPNMRVLVPSELEAYLEETTAR